MCLRHEICGGVSTGRQWLTKSFVLSTKLITMTLLLPQRLSLERQVARTSTYVASLEPIRERSQAALPSDTPGLLLNVVVHPADVQDGDGAFHLLRRARRLFPFIKRIFADGGYAGDKMARVGWCTGAWKLKS